MGLSIDDEPHEDAVVLRLVGRLDTVTSRTLEEHIAAHVARGHRRLVLDLAGIDYISSYGLRVFLLNAKKLKGAEDAFALCSVTPGVRKILEISGFDRILTIRRSVAEALDAHKGPDP